jgi:recombination protein RecR
MSSWNKNQDSTPRDAVSKLVFELSKLPGIGEKTATRLANHILKQELSYAETLAQALVTAKSATRLCKVCFTFTDTDVCRICMDSTRLRTSICVVERPSDVIPIEQSGAHRGTYHVLHGSLSPMDGIGPDELKIRELLERIKTDGGIQEVLVATNPSVEGEATAIYLSRLIRPFQIKVTQLAHGLPVGGVLEYTDRQTIGRAIINRVEIR